MFGFGFVIIFLRAILGSVLRRAHVGAPHPEDYILGNVRRVVCDALKIARDQQNVQRLPCAGRIVVHLPHQVDERLIFHAIDDAVHLQHRFRDFRFAIEKDSRARCTIVLTPSAIRGMSTGKGISGSLIRSSTRCAMLTA